MVVRRRDLRRSGGRIRARSRARAGCGAPRMLFGPRSSGASHLLALAMAFTYGARHDLGFYDALVLFALTGLLYALEHRRSLQGKLLAVLAVGYGPARFFLDFLRATDLPYSDARYLGLPPAQFAALALIAYRPFRLLLSPMIASAAMSLSSVSVIGNALRLRSARI